MHSQRNSKKGQKIERSRKCIMNKAIEWGGIKPTGLEKYNSHWGKEENNDYEFNYKIVIINTDFIFVNLEIMPSTKNGEGWWNGRFD